MLHGLQMLQDTGGANSVGAASAAWLISEYAAIAFMNFLRWLSCKASMNLQEARMGLPRLAETGMGLVLT